MRAHARRSDTPDEETRGSRGSWGARELPVATHQSSAHRSLFNKIRGYRAGSSKRDTVSRELGSSHIRVLAPDTPVTKGETLLKLDDRDQALAVRQAEVELAEAKRTLKRYLSLNATEANIPQSTIYSTK